MFFSLGTDRFKQVQATLYGFLAHKDGGIKRRIKSVRIPYL
jgi:hypothetical protein